jgi:hypothetical protein
MQSRLWHLAHRPERLHFVAFEGRADVSHDREKIATYDDAA